MIQKARQGYVDSSGQPKPLSQGDLAKMLNLKSTIVQECAWAPFRSCPCFVSGEKC